MLKDIVKYLLLVSVLPFLAFCDDNPPESEIPDITDSDTFKISQKFGMDDTSVTIHFKLTKGTYYSIYYDLEQKVDPSQYDHCHQPNPKENGVYWANVRDTNSGWDYIYVDKYSMGYPNGSVHHRMFLRPGIYHWTFTCTFGNPHLDWPGFFQGVFFNLVYLKTGVCPNSAACVKTTCQICSHEYCANHESHYTGIFRHDSLQRFQNDNTVHYHCSNSQALIQQWSEQVTGRCNVCGEMYCKICGHRQCGAQEGSCPNLPNCTIAVCDECGGNYCGTHNLHLCSGYTDYGSGFNQAPFTVQTTVQGTANVTVNVSTNTDVEDIALDTHRIKVNTDDIEALVTQLDTKMAQHIQKINRLVELGELTKADVDSMTENLSLVVPSQVQANDIIIGKVGAGIESHYLVVQSLPDKLDDIKDEQSDTNEKLDDTNDKLDDIREKLAAMLIPTVSNAQQTAQINSRLPVLNENLTSLNSKIASLTSSYNNNSSLTNSKLDSANTALEGILSELQSNQTAPSLSPIAVASTEITIPQMNFRVISSLNGITSKLVPTVPHASGSSTYTFQLPCNWLPFSIPAVTFDLEDSRLSPLIAVSRCICLCGYSLMLLFGIIKVLRQY